MTLIQHEQDSPEVIATVRARITAMAGVIRKLSAHGDAQSLIGWTQELAGTSGYLAALHEHRLLSSEMYTSLMGEKTAAAVAAKANPADCV